MEAIVLLLTYALTSALVYSDGAFGIMYRIRDIEWVKNFGLLECYLCTSFWVGLGVSLLAYNKEALSLYGEYAYLNDIR